MKSFIIVALFLSFFILPSTSFARVKVSYLQIRECGNIISLRAKRSLQDKLNKKVKSKVNRIKSLKRVISINYTKSKGIIRKNCALATVWYEYER
ncbi:MAG: hypothetical protein ACI86H_001165 [bacterium]|jgi:hypothetical protein